MKVVLSLHSIRTRGVWQKDLVPHLATNGFIPVAVDYGATGALELATPGTLNRHVDRLVAEYDRICAETRCSRPSVIAHSFGTLQVAHLLRKYDHVCFEKVILAASIAPRDFDWPYYLASRRVQWVENDYGGCDIWPKVAQALVPGAGASGTVGFDVAHPALHQVHYPHHRHSDWFSHGHFARSWMPTLRIDKRRMIDGMDRLLNEISVLNGIDLSRLRAFVFQPAVGADHLVVVPGLCVGSLAEGEDKVTIGVAEEAGLTEGPAFAYKSGFMSYLETKDSWTLRRNAANNVRLHDDLKWSLSIPLPKGDGSEGTAAVLVIDGLEYPRPHGGVVASKVELPHDANNTLLALGRVMHSAQFGGSP